jgi:replicative DNA helicase
VTEDNEPSDLRAERAVLGAVMQNDRVFPLVDALLSEHDFHHPRHRRYWRAYRALHKRGLAVDTITLPSELGEDFEKLGGLPGVVSVLEEGCMPGHAEHYAKVVVAHATRRRLIVAADEIKHAAITTTDADLTVDLAQRKVASVARKQSAGNEPATLASAVHAFVRELYTRHDNPTTVQAPYITTGFDAVDELLVGLFEEEFTILGGRPGMGKTQVALAMADRIARLDRGPVLFFSGEMSLAKLAMRWLTQTTGFDSKRLQRGDLHEDDLVRLAAAAGEAEKVGIIIDDTPNPHIHYVRNRARLMAVDGKPAAVFVDHIHLMRSDEREQRDRIDAIGSGLKGLCREMGVPLVALAQLSRECEKRQNKRPVKSDLRDSGSLEQDADNILFAYRDAVYNDADSVSHPVEIIAAKVKSGKLGTARLWFDRGRFVDEEQAQQQPLRMPSTSRPVSLQDAMRAILKAGAMTVDELMAKLDAAGQDAVTHEVWKVLEAEGWDLGEGIVGLPRAG